LVWIRKYCFLQILIFSVFLLLSCGNTKTTNPDQGKTNTVQKDTASLSYRKPPSSFNDTLIIRGEVAVFFTPDSLQLEKIKFVRKKMDFESDTHDCFFQQQNARKVLKQYWSGIKIIEISKARFLLFILNDGRKTLTDLNTINDMCGIFLFNEKKKPEFTDMMNIDTELRYYFSE
jgi:hypothetical protein